MAKGWACRGKAPPKGKLVDVNNSDRIRREYETLTKLRHPRIVEVFELLEFDVRSHNRP